MEYTIEQKAVALLTNTLWWRFPESVSGAQVWSRIKDDLKDIGTSDLELIEAEYFIGDKPPRVLSDLERELLAALEQADRDFEGEDWGQDGPYRAHIRAAIAKAKGEA